MTDEEAMKLKEGDEVRVRGKEHKYVVERTWGPSERYKHLTVSVRRPELIQCRNGRKMHYGSVHKRPAQLERWKAEATTLDPIDAIPHPSDIQTELYALRQRTRLLRRLLKLAMAARRLPEMPK